MPKTPSFTLLTFATPDPVARVVLNISPLPSAQQRQLGELMVRLERWLTKNPTQSRRMLVWLDRVLLMFGG